MTERRIIIEEVGVPKQARPKPEKPPALDLQDRLILGGIASAEIAALLIWWKAALILAAMFCFLFAYLIEMAKAKEAKIEATKTRKQNGTPL